MGRIVLSNRKGMTLIEVMMALLILAIVSLALMQTALLGMKENLRNAIRDEAVNLADQKMNELRNTASTDVTPGTYDYPPMERKFRASSVWFTPQRNVTQVGSDINTKQITMSIGWTFSGQTYTHSVTTIVRGQ
jgi:type IV pilus assembly protein PilV